MCSSFYAQKLIRVVPAPMAGPTGVLSFLDGKGGATAFFSQHFDEFLEAGRLRGEWALPTRSAVVGHLESRRRTNTAGGDPFRRPPLTGDAASRACALCDG